MIPSEDEYKVKKIFMRRRSKNKTDRTYENKGLKKRGQSLKLDKSKKLFYSYESPKFDMRNGQSPYLEIGASLSPEKFSKTQKRARRAR